MVRSSLGLASEGPNLPLTSRQSLFWVDTLLNPEIPVNRVLTRLDVEGAVDTPRFEAAFERLVASADALRARIHPDGTRMYFASSALAPLSIVDAIDEVDASAAVYDLCLERFGPDAPLFRGLLVRFGAERWSFFLNQHHVITDSLSCVRLHEALSRLYVGEAPGLEPRAVERRLGRLDDAQARAYWATRFETPCHPQRYYGLPGGSRDALTIRVRRRLPADLGRAIASRPFGMSPSRIFTTALLGYLRRVVPEDDLCIGVPLLNRTSDPTQALGLFMEICPNRVEVREGEPLSVLAEQVAQEVAAVRPYRAATVAARTAGFDVLLNHHPASPTRFAGARAKYELTTPLNLLSELGPGWPQEREVGTSEALIVHVHRDEDSDELDLFFDFNGSVWSDLHLRERAPTHFVRVLEAVVEGGDVPLGALDLLAEDERRVVFVDSNRAPPTRVSLPSVVDRFESGVERHPERVAVVAPDRTLTYREVLDRVHRLAAHLQSLGVGPGTLVAVHLGRTEDLPVALLAILRAGGAYVPLSPQNPPARNQMVMEDAAPVALVGDDDAARALADAPGCTYVELGPRIWEGLPAAEPLRHPSPELAYVIFTSGSTGRPKGVRVLHHGLSAFMTAMLETPGMAPTDRILALTTVSFDIAGLELFLPLLAGASLRIVPYETSIDGARLVELIDGREVTMVQATPATYRMLLAAGWAARPRPLKILCGGEAMPPDLASALLARATSVYNMYGPTETTIWSTLDEVEPDARVTVGKPIRGTKILVVNGQLQAVPLGVAGELLIGGDGVAEGYHGRPDLTAERFIPDPFASSGRVYRTGDRVRLNSAGKVEYLGRMDFQVKIRGFRVELPEIEAVLDGHSGVEQSVVLASPDSTGELALTAYVVRRTVALDAGSLAAHARAVLPPYMVPASFVWVSSFPLNPNGKVDRKALAESMAAATASPVMVAAPANQLQASLLGAWRQVLRREHIGVDDDFFQIGGHSIMALELAKAIEQATGIALSLGAIFETPTISGLEEKLRSKAATSTASIVVPLNEGGSAAPIFFLCGIELYRPLAQALPEGLPAFGIYVEEEHQLLEWAASGETQDIPVRDLARSYQEAIRRHSPEGPYRLAGVSFGGLLAYEVALMLDARGDRVELVVLLDSLLPHAVRRNPWKFARSQASRLAREGVGPRIERMRQRLGEKLLRIDRMPGSARPLTGLSEAEARIAQVRDRAFDRAAEAYRTGTKYRGRVLLVKALDQLRAMEGLDVRPDYGWKDLVAGRLDVRESMGDHLGMLQPPHASGLAAIIASSLSGG